MAESSELRSIKDKLDAAMAKDRLDEAAELLIDLERLEPHEARWSQRLGDLYRRARMMPEAITAYERAVIRYEKGGFLPRAIAMAKTITSIDPSRTDVLARIQQAGAKDMRARAHAQQPQTNGKPAPQLHPAGVVAPPGGRAQVAPPPLAYAEDASDLDDLLPVPEDLPLGDDDDDDDLSGESLDLDEPHDEDPEHYTAQRLALLPSFALFADVPHEALMELAERSELIELEPEAVLIRAGDPADSLYAIVEGRVRVHVPGDDDDAHFPLGEGELFGEACLLTDEPRHADVVVDQHLLAFCIPKETLDDLVKRYEQVGRVLLGLLVRRLIVNLVRSSPLFTVLDLETRREVVGLFELLRAPSGTTLLAAGKRGDGLYIPLTGKLAVTRKDGKQLTLPAGSMVGMASLMSHAALVHTVSTQGDSVLLKLPSSRFMELITQYPTVLEQISQLPMSDALTAS